MKKILIYSVLGLLFSGCVTNTVYVKQPCEVKYPKFSIEQFKKAKDKTYTFKICEHNSTSEVFGLEEEEFYEFVREYKKIKYDYNLLIDSTKDFNRKLSELETK